MALSLNKALKATEKKVQEAMEEDNQTDIFMTTIDAMVSAQEQAQKAESGLSWIARFRKPPTGKGPVLTSEVCEEAIDVGKAALDEIIVRAKMLRTLM